MIFNGNYNIVIKNFAYLSILKGLDIGLPLLIIPYLTHVLGTSYFGKYSFVLAIIQTINIFTSYGYLFSATKKISQNRDDKHVVNQIMNAVFAGRFIVATFIVVLVVMLSNVIFKDEYEWFMFLTAIGMIYGDIFIPTWLFQGLEQMKYVTIVNAIAKLLFTMLVFAIVTRQQDFKYILLLNSLGCVTSAFFSMVLVKRMFKLHLFIPKWSVVREELKDGFSIFLSTLGMSVYRNLNIIILNYFVSSSAVGIYALAEKVIKALQSLINPISQALYPHFGYRIKESANRKKDLYSLFKIAVFLTILLVVASLALYFLTGYVGYVVGHDFTGSSGIINIMLPVVVFGCLNYLLGFVGLVNMDKQRFFLGAVVVSGTVAIIILLCTVNTFGIESAAWAMSISELLLFAFCFIKLFCIYRHA
jgi:PST family polysaccharide transporter